MDLHLRNASLRHFCNGPRIAWRGGGAGLPSAARLVMIAALVLSGCTSKRVPQPASSPASPPDGGSQVMQRPHGGLVERTALGHLELLVDRAGAFRVYLLDERFASRPVTDRSGLALVNVPGYGEVHLVPQGDHLAGLGTATSRDHFTVAVSVAGTAPESARFAVHLGADGLLAGPSDAHEHARAAPRVPAGGTSIVGRIIDATCLAHGEAPEADHSECALRCIRGGSPIAIVEEGTGQVYVALAGPGKYLSEILLPLVGRRSAIFGRVVKSGGANLFLVEDAVPEHDHRACQGGAVAMMGELHLEVVALRSGEVQVFLSDAFRKPLSAGGRKGMVEAKVAGRPTEPAPLVPDTSGRYLRAQLAALPAGPVEVTLRLPLPGDPGYFITFSLEPRDARGATPSAPAAAPAPAAEDVHIEVQGSYQPSRIVLKKGRPVRLHFFRRDTASCSAEIKLPGLEPKTLVPLAETVIPLVPEQAGEFDFTCGMGMMRGRIVVEE